MKILGAVYLVFGKVIFCLRETVRQELCLRRDRNLTFSLLTERL